MEREQLVARIGALREELRTLEDQLAVMDTRPWQPPPYYVTYYVLAGFSLGLCGAITSLLFNVIGSLLVGQHALKFIQVYLTFPLGEAALTLDNWLTLTIGCCLYLVTGMFLGIPFHLVLARFPVGTAWMKKFLVVTAMSLALWIFNYYLVLAWLQPLLFGGNWIVKEIPPWIAAATHLVFGWTMLMVLPLGTYHASSPRPHLPHVEAV